MEDLEGAADISLALLESKIDIRQQLLGVGAARRARAIPEVTETRVSPALVAMGFTVALAMRSLTSLGQCRFRFWTGVITTNS